jgi:hypothetical protein
MDFFLWGCMDLRCVFPNFTGFGFRGGLYGIYMDLFRSTGLIYKEFWEILWILYGMLYVIYIGLWDLYTWIYRDL